MVVIVYCIAQSLKAIQSAVATSARENTAAAAQEAQQLLQGGPRRPRKHSLQAKRAKKRKRHAVRSRNSYVDAVLNDEEVRSVRYTYKVVCTTARARSTMSAG